MSEATSQPACEGRGREACERCQGREFSRGMKAPPKGPIVFGALRHLSLGQPTKLGVDRLGDSNGRHHQELIFQRGSPQRRLFCSSMAKPGPPSTQFYDRATIDYDKAIELDLKYVNAYYNRGNASFNKNESRL